MPVNKAHDEFHTLDMDAGWVVPPGYPEGIQMKILSGALDEEGRQGSRTRLLRFDPGVFTTKPFVHDYWEEVFLIRGDLTIRGAHGGGVGEDATFQPFTYACRPPGAAHGPFRSDEGCLLLEIHYYDPV